MAAVNPQRGYHSAVRTAPPTPDDAETKRGKGADPSPLPHHAIARPAPGRFHETPLPDGGDAHERASEAARAPISRHCESCGSAIDGRPGKKFCSGACRARHSREQRARAIQDVLDRLAEPSATGSPTSSPATARDSNLELNLSAPTSGAMNCTQTKAADSLQESAATSLAGTGQTPGPRERVAAIVTRCARSFAALIGRRDTK